MQDQSVQSKPFDKQKYDKFKNLKVW
jgi:hypothetical protein